MFTAADVIEVLAQRRRRKSLRPEVPGQLPPGWQSWLDTMPVDAEGVTGARARDLVASLLERPLDAAPPRDRQLNRWQAFATLWRQQWQAPLREERGTRWLAIGASGALHCVLVLLLLWLAYVRIAPLPPAARGDSVVQVEFIGRGTPADGAGGAAPQPTPSPRPSPPSTPTASTGAEVAAPTASLPPRPAEPPAQDAPVSPPVPSPAQAPEASPEPQPAPQPLQVTEVDVPDSDFVLPPPRPRDVAVPEASIRVPDLQAPTPRIAEVEVPKPVSVEAPRAAVRRERPSLRQAAEAIVPEEPAQRLPAARAIAVPQRAADIQMPTLRTAPRALALPSDTAAPPAATAATAEPATPAAPAAPAAATAAAATNANAAAPGAPARAPGAATRTAAPPGAWPSPDRADDWGDAARNRPGAQAGRRDGAPGLFNADGTPRLADAPPASGHAPGTVEQRIADLDRAGTWLKRPPYDYEPTAFDKYWRPSETLLQEWVRKGIKSLSIPIPGTDKKLECVVSLLQFGGGCGIRDPNLNEQPSSGKPPPDIPFKPELQENNGSVRPAPAGRP